MVFSLELKTENDSRKNLLKAALHAWHDNNKYLPQALVMNPSTYYNLLSELGPDLIEDFRSSKYKGITIYKSYEVHNEIVLIA